MPYLTQSVIISQLFAMPTPSEASEPPPPPWGGERASAEAASDGGLISQCTGKGARERAIFLRRPAEGERSDAHSALVLPVQKNWHHVFFHRSVPDLTRNPPIRLEIP
jgi:hypothetical protein